ncbi:MAG: site-specific integrase [Chitinophagaceae bacterium]|nr:site-specific integrase [Anaerolineae bacterium]
MSNELAILPSQPTAIQLAGQAANRVASKNVFEDYKERKAANTLRRQRADLELFARYMGTAKVWDESLDLDTPEANTLRRSKADELQSTPDAWHGITWGIISSFVGFQKDRGYAIASINVRLSTVKKYMALAFKAGVIDATEHALIRTVEGYKHSEAKNADEKRTTAGTATRYNRPGAKKADAVSIPDATAKTLKTGNLDTAQGRRDALLMCLLLDHGLRCGEVALLKVGNFNLADSTMTFYRPKVDKVQTHNLTADTRRALNAWVESGDCPLLAEVPILRGSTKGGALTSGGMSERAITKRVAYVGAQHDLTGLSAHDCRHYWATRASRKGTDPFSLQEAGGWNSLAMPRRYVEDAKIANAGVKLD